MSKNPNEVVILGIDPGYDRLGWCIGKTKSGGAIIEKFGIITTPKTLSLFKRYQQVDTELQKVILEFSPQEAAVESLFFFKNQTTALQVSEVRGVIMSCLFRHNVQFFEYTPLQIKQAVTGYGRADKKAVEKMIRMQLNQQKTTEVAQNPKIGDDTIDAIAITLTHAVRRGK